MDVVTRADEDLLLELLNTTPVVDGERSDELASWESARLWATSHEGSGAADEITALRRVRDAIQGVIRGELEPQALAVHLERIALVPRMTGDVLRWELRAADDHTLAARALLAWVAISERSPERLRPCANPECCRFLLDRSNANAARWCSMAVCGNRAKARRHYQRRRAAAAG